jgi:hypothetical protein
MTDWLTLAHVADAPPADWREQLAARLGRRPRRLGRWTELGLYGALRCLDQAGEAALPAEAHLRVISFDGPIEAVRAAALQCRSGLPMPFTFMQSQQSQMLAALSRHLGWQGDARYTLSRDLAALWRLARCEAPPEGMLIGWVEDGPAPKSEWWRVRPG